MNASTWASPVHQTVLLLIQPNAPCNKAQCITLSLLQKTYALKNYMLLWAVRVSVCHADDKVSQQYIHTLSQGWEFWIKGSVLGQNVSTLALPDQRRPVCHDRVEEHLSLLRPTQRHDKG